MDNSYPLCPFLSIFGQLIFLQKKGQKKNVSNNIFLISKINQTIMLLTRFFTFFEKKILRENFKMDKKKLSIFVL